MPAKHVTPPMSFSLTTKGKTVWSLLLVILSTFQIYVSTGVLSGHPVNYRMTVRPFHTAHTAGTKDSRYFASPTRPESAPALREEQRIAAYGQLALSFEENLGQNDSRVRFTSRGSGYNLSLTSTGAVLTLFKQAARKNRTGAIKPEARRPEAMLRLNLVGANADPRVIGLEELPGKVNYFLGNDPAKWRTDVPTYAKVHYKNVYSGVDMVYYGNQRQLEYDLVVAPGTSPAVIALSIEGSKAVTLNPQGEIVLDVAGGQVVMRKPDIYQESGGVRHAIQGGYTLPRPRQIDFQVGDYDPTKPLIIDPVVVYSTFLGGGLADLGRGIAVDGAGNAYVTGVTYSTDFPTLNAAQSTSGGGPEVFVSKLNPAGNALIYSTYLGGNGQDFGNGVAVDGAGNAYVTGITDSANFPTVNAYQPTSPGPADAFVAKLNAAGNALVYSTYLGGYTTDAGMGIAVDGAGSAYVTGETASNNFPTLGAYQSTLQGWDAFVVKFNPAGNGLIYSTLLGGSSYETGYGIAVDGAGSAYVTGVTYSANFPKVNPAQPTFGGGGRDGFITKFNAAGNAPIYSTFLGGGGADYSLDIAVDGAGSAYVTGYTFSTNFPRVNPFQSTFGGGITDAFVTKLNAAGNAFAYSTYLGGGAEDMGNGIAVDGAGNAYVTGHTLSTNFPTALPLQATLGSAGASDAFAAKLDPPGTLGFSTYLGGAGDDQAYGIAVDGAGSIYLTGRAFSSDFPTVNPYQATNNGNADAFVTKISILTPCVAPPNTTMVAWYPFDEAVGITAANLATGNTGSHFGGPAVIPGKVGNALRFDGWDDYVESPSTIVTNIGPADLPATCSGAYSTCRGDFSIDTWIRMQSGSSTLLMILLEKEAFSGSAMSGYSLWIFNGYLMLQLADGGAGGGSTNYISALIPISTLYNNQWHHIAVTISRRGNPAGISWYLDGVVISTNNPTASPTRYGSLANNAPLHIGGPPTPAWLGWLWFKGDIDELEIFNRELTQAEVKGIFTAGAAGKCK